MTTMADNRVRVVVDTREQHPYEFPVDRFEVIRAALPAGDYSIVGQETRIAIERKSMADYVGTVIRNKDRFSRELKKLVMCDFAAILVECSLRDIYEHRYGGGARPSSVMGATFAITTDWRIPVFFCGDRQAAREYLIGLLERLSKRAKA